MMDFSRDEAALTETDGYEAAENAAAGDEAVGKEDEYPEIQSPDGVSDAAAEYEAVDTDDEYSESAADGGGISLDSDLEELKREFCELSGAESITELKNPIRYAALRELGLTAVEAYLATTPRTDVPDTRAHLRSSVPSAVKSPYGAMTRQEMRAARDLFGDMNDAEIQNLYNKVTRQN